MVKWKEVKWNRLVPVLKFFVVHLEAPKRTIFSGCKRRYLKQRERRNICKLKKLRCCEFPSSARNCFLQSLI